MGDLFFVKAPGKGDNNNNNNNKKKQILRLPFNNPLS